MIGGGEALGGCYYCLSLHMNTTKVLGAERAHNQCCVNISINGVVLIIPCHCTHAPPEKDIIMAAAAVSWED